MVDPRVPNWSVTMSEQLGVPRKTVICTSWLIV